MNWYATFVACYSCNNKENINFEEKQKRSWFNWNLRPSFNSSNISRQNSISFSKSTDFSIEIVFKFGIEAELTLPFNKNNWSNIIEPTYSYYKSKKRDSKS